MGVPALSFLKPPDPIKMLNPSYAIDHLKNRVKNPFGNPDKKPEAASTTTQSTKSGVA